MCLRRWVCAAGVSGGHVAEGWHPGEHPHRDREQCLEPGLAKKPLSPVPPGASQGSLLAHPSWGRGASTGRFWDAPSQTPVGLFTWRFYSPTELPRVCVTPLSPPHLPVFISLSTYEDLIYNREFCRLAASFSYQFQ